MAYFQIFRGKDGQWRFRFKGDNHEIVAPSEGYSSLAACQHGIEVLKQEAAGAPILFEERTGMFGARRRGVTVLGSLMTKP